MSIKKAAACALFFLAFFIPVSDASEFYSEAASHGFQFVETPIDARITAMGNAATAGLHTGGFDIYNPATTGIGTAHYASVHIGIFAAGDNRNVALEGGWDFGTWFFASGVRSHTVDNIVETSGDGNYVGATSSQQQTIMTLSTGVNRGNMAFGVNLHGLQDRISSETAHAASMSLGMVARIIPGRLRIGIAGFHLNDYLESTRLSTRFFEEGEEVRLPVYGRAGAVYIDTVWNLHTRIAIDGVYRTVDHRVMIPAGCAITPASFEYLTLRIGKRINHDTELFSFGVGLTLENIGVNLGCILPRFVDDTRVSWNATCTYFLTR